MVITGKFLDRFDKRRQRSRLRLCMAFSVCALVAGCEPGAPHRDEVGKVLREVPELPGMEEPYPLPLPRKDVKSPEATATPSPTGEESAATAAEEQPDSGR